MRAASLSFFLAPEEVHSGLGRWCYDEWFCGKQAASERVSESGNGQLSADYYGRYNHGCSLVSWSRRPVGVRVVVC